MSVPCCVFAAGPRGCLRFRPAQCCRVLGLFLQGQRVAARVAQALRTLTSKPRSRESLRVCLCPSWLAC